MGTALKKNNNKKLAKKNLLKVSLGAKSCAELRMDYLSHSSQGEGPHHYTHLFWPHPWQAEIPRPRITAEPQH